MQCPSCQNTDSRVLESRAADAGRSVRRRRECLNCEFRFTTYERVETVPISVIKKNGRRSPFDREKLAKSLFTALKKRTFDPDTIEKIVSRISRDLEEMGQSEIQSSVIGKKVMDTLRDLDKIAYVRFASVYTNFKEVGEFGDYIEELDGEKK